MSDFIESYITRFKKERLINKLNSFFKKLIKKSEKFTKKSKIKIEIEKNKIEKKKKLIDLGKFIHKSYKEEKIKDFSYKEQYLDLNNEVDKIESYIEKLRKNKDSII